MKHFSIIFVLLLMTFSGCVSARLEGDKIFGRGIGFESAKITKDKDGVITGEISAKSFFGWPNIKLFKG